MSRAQVMNRSHYVELGRTIGLQMTGIHRQDQMMYEMSKGDQLVFIESLARMKCCSLHDIWTELNPDLDIIELEHYSESLRNFKNSKLLNDFTDMLEKFYEQGYKPDLDVLFVDEAQDLCRLQWKVVEEMSRKSKITYIAGDDDQAIFRWSGADIDYFQNLTEKHQTEVLDQSYRLPKKIFDFSLRIVNKVSFRTAKEFKPTKEIGFVDYIAELDDVNMDTGKWLILVRNTYLMNPIIEQIRDMGYSYETTAYSLKEDEAVRAAVTWEGLRQGKQIMVTEVKTMLEYIGRRDLGVNQLTLKGKDDRVDMKYLVGNGILAKGLDTKIWHEALSAIPVDDREYYISVRRRGEKLTEQPRIKISTIHGAKGGECENVVLYTDMSNRTYKGYMDNEDDELRVFYVGATRAKKNLYIMLPKTINCIQF
jgi:DNA helicase-2/ATP-dependent DNA helicase PcrA